VLFNSSYNHGNVVDREFGELYMNLVKKFQIESTRETDDDTVRHKSRLSGLKALESLCDSESFLKRTDLGDYIEMIIPAVLLNIADTRPSTVRVTSPAPDMHRRMSIQDQLITEVELKNISIHCLSALFSSASATSLKLILSAFYNVLDAKKHWSNPHYILKLFTIIVEAVKSEYRYIVTAALFERLETEPDIAFKTTVVNVLKTLIASETSLMGLTIPELLETFCSHIYTMCLTKPSETDLEQKPLQESLIQAIGI
jgi:hypothetical protein